jgi:spore coat protein A, manganese oxidase
VIILIPAPESTLNPKHIPKFKNQLLIPPVYQPNVAADSNTGAITHHYFINIVQFKQQILPYGFPSTTVWGYEGKVKNSLYDEPYLYTCSPGATFEAVRGIPVVVTWINKLSGPHLFAVDPKVPIVTHLHGGEVPSIYDGHPEAWQTYDGKTGDAFVTNKYVYPNTQQSATLWYHDNSLGMERLNVYAGLAGIYLLRDGGNLLDNKATTVLPSGKYEIPLIIQDRSFNADGSLFFTKSANNPDSHPYRNPELLRNAIIVNGRVWPNLNIERCKYRFRLLNGSNARFYNLKLSNNMTFTQIGTDGGYLAKPVELTSLLMAPGERADILIDFSSMDAGTSVLLLNDAPSPFPKGVSPDPDTTGQIMRFSIPRQNTKTAASLPLPNLLNTIPKFGEAKLTRTLTLVKVISENGPAAVLLNGQKWSSPISELPKAGDIEVWEIVNLTDDAHPIHLHLVQFQILNRQDINTEGYFGEWMIRNGIPPTTKAPVNPAVAPYLTGEALLPDTNENGWKDTVRANPNQVTRIIVRFAPQNASPAQDTSGVNLYSFDPTFGPGYLWSCNILDNKDNQMIRPYTIEG